MDDAEFQETLKNVLQDDEQAKMAMDGIMQMMDVLGKAMGTENVNKDSAETDFKDAEKLFTNLMGSQKNEESANQASNEEQKETQDFL